MAGKRKESNPLKTLIILLAASVILCGLAFAGFTVMTNIAKSDNLRRDEIVQSENDRIEREYNQALADARRTQPPTDSEDPMPTGDGWEVLDMSGSDLGNTRSEDVSRTDLMLGGLFLINRWHSLPADYPEAVYTSIGTRTNGDVPVKDYNVTLAPLATDALLAMVTAAKEEAGLESYIVQQGYRTVMEQTTLYQARVDALSERYTGEVLYAKAAESISKPGTGEYQTGVSFQLSVYGSTDDVRGKSLQETAQGAWVNENGWRFGIVFRFPTLNYPNVDTTDKTYKTGESRKMDIYRYVGVANATAMHVMDMCLEEYIEYLMNHPHIALYENGELRYEIYREAATSDAMISVPVLTNAVSYSASLDNMGGLVVCVTH